MPFKILQSRIIKRFENYNIFLCVFSCTHCLWYVEHQLVHTDDRPHGCNLCTKQFKIRKLLDLHVKVVHTKRTKEFGCTECNKRYFTKSSLIRHQNIHKNNREGFSKCYFCHIKISQSSDLVTHMRIHTQEKPFACIEESCNYSTAHSNLLKKHKLRFHRSTSTSNQIIRRIWTCYFCSKTDNKYDNLILHMRRHTKEVPFKCSFCMKKYINQQYLTHHIASHTNEKPFKCSQCHKEFKTSGHLKKHMVSHTKEQRYFCQFCSYGTYFKTDFNRHLLNRHKA